MGLSTNQTYWKDDLAIENTGSSSKGLRFYSQHIYGGSKLSVTAPSGNL